MLALSSGSTADVSIYHLLEEAGGPMTPEERAEKTRVEEHLAQMLDAKDEEIEKLKDELRAAHRELEWGPGWTRHVKVEDDGKLPIPRLEIVFRKEDYGAFIATYRLVKKHLDGTLYGVPLGETKMSGYGDRLPDETPWRDGCHMAFDAAHLGLPAFLCALGQEPKPIDLEGYRGQVSRGKEARRLQHPGT
jgi:hypothetical protein